MIEERRRVIAPDAPNLRVVVAGRDEQSVDEIEALLGDERVEVVGSARSYNELGRVQDLSEPDVVLMDRRMCGEAPIERRAREGSPALVLLPSRTVASRRPDEGEALEVFDVILGLASASAAVDLIR